MSDRSRGVMRREGALSRARRRTLARAFVTFSTFFLFAQAQPPTIPIICTHSRRIARAMHWCSLDAFSQQGVWIMAKKAAKKKAKKKATKKKAKKKAR